MIHEPKSLRIAAAQYPLDRFEGLAGYREKLARWVAEAAADGAELLVFPEYGAMEYAAIDAASTGDLTRSLAVVSAASDELVPDHVDAARRHGVHILAASGPCRQADGSYVNRAKLFAPSGVYGWQDKLMMTPFEKDWGISSGRCARVFDTALGVIGIAICYDSEFPLVARAMCEAGADIILVPSCTEYVSGFHRVRTAARARALENGCVTVQASTIGQAEWCPAVDRNCGAAGIFVPAEHNYCDTGVIAEGVADVAGWTMANVDLARLREVRAHGEMRNAGDWPQQFGAVPLAGYVARIALG